MSVAILMGSDSDLDVVSKAFDVLDGFEVKYTKNVLSAHRTPAEVLNLVNNAESIGIKVFIAAAGMAAHLAGVVAAHTTLPVIGIPIPWIFKRHGLTSIYSSNASWYTSCYCSHWIVRCKKCSYSSCPDSCYC